MHDLELRWLRVIEGGPLPAEDPAPPSAEPGGTTPQGAAKARSAKPS
jgi:hypothetical protein